MSQTIGSGEGGKWYRVEVTASNNEGSATVDSRAYRVDGDVINVMAMGTGCSIRAAVAGQNFLMWSNGSGYCDYAPSLSPDGTLVAFASGRPPATSSAPGIFLSNINGTSMRMLVNGGTHSLATPTFSPDGSKIAYVDTTAWTIHVINVDGTGDQVLASGGSVIVGPKWSRDGTSIAYLKRNVDGSNGQPWKYFWRSGTGYYRTSDPNDTCMNTQYVSCFMTSAIWTVDVATGIETQAPVDPSPTNATDYATLKTHKQNPRGVAISPADGRITFDNTADASITVSPNTYLTAKASSMAYRSDGSKVFYFGTGCGSNQALCGIMVMNPDFTGGTAYATNAPLGTSYAPYAHGFINPDVVPTVPVEQTFGFGELGINPSGSASDPVNTATGAFTTTHPDAILPALALPFSFQRSYTSADTSVGDFGPGWQDSYGWKLSVSGSTVTIRGGSGQQVKFTNNSGTWVPAAGVDATLVAISGGYKLTTGDRNSYTFTSSGKLTAISDPNGRQVSLAYNGSGCLDSITDTVGRVVDVQTSAGGCKISALVLPDGRHVDYTYDASGRLATVSDLRGKVWTYAYDGTTSRLVSVLDPSGHYPYRNTYDATSGRVTQQLDALGNATTFSWSTGVGAGSGTATITDPAGNVSKDSYAGYKLITRTDPTGGSAQFTYDKNLNVIQIIDPAGHSTKLTYDSRGRPLTKIDPAGDFESWSYDTSGHLLTHTDPRGKTWRFSYDGNGRLWKRIAPDGSTTAEYGYDSLGRLTSLKDGRGKTTSYTYNALDQLTDATSPLGAKRSFTYNAAALVATIVDPRGNATGATQADYMTSWTYDNANNPLTETDPYEHTQSWTYTDAGLLQTHTNQLDKTWTYAYNAANELTSESAPDGSAAHYEYDSRGNQTAAILPSGAKTGYGYDPANRVVTMTTARGYVSGADPADYTWHLGYGPNGNLTSIRDPLSQTTTLTYDALGRRTSLLNPRGKTTSWAYDEAGYLLSKTDGNGNTINYGYDDLGRLGSLSDGRGKTTSFEYSAAGQIAAVTDPVGNRTSYGYDDDGRLTSVVDPRGNVNGANPDDFTTSYDYNLDGQITAVTDPLGNTTGYGYDRAGRPVTATDPLEHTTQWGYDAVGRITSVTDPLDHQTSYSYDDLGNLTSRTDANNHTTAFGYDADGRRTSATDPLGNVTSYGFDADGNLTQTVDGNGNATTEDPNDGTTINTFDRLDRLTGIDYSDGTPAVSYGYDADSNRSTMSDGNGTVTYHYDDGDRLTSVTRGDDAFSYTYDAADNITGRIQPDGTQIDYAYDDAERLASVGTGSETTSYGYDPAGELTTTTLPNGYVEQRSHDNAGRLAELQNENGDNALSDYQITRDAAGNPTEIDNAGETETYGYDAAGRLTNVCFQASCPNQADPKIEYSYDSVGNRTSEQSPSGTTDYTYNAADQLTQRGSTTLTYDADGQQLTNGAKTYTWNLAGQLSSASDGTTTVNYSYDGNGNRSRASIVGGAVTKYLWDGSFALPQLALERDDSNNLLRRYTTGLGTTSMSTGPDLDYYLYDPIGSVTALTSSTAATEWTYAWEPFGSQRSATKVDPDAPANPLGYTGQYLDPESGLYNLRARQYDPDSGSFLSTDPLEPTTGAAATSPYAYVGGRPTVDADPAGMSACSFLHAERLCNTVTDTADTVLKIDTGIREAPRDLVMSALNDVRHPIGFVQSIGYLEYRADATYNSEGVAGLSRSIGSWFVQPFERCISESGGAEATSRRCTKLLASLIPLGRLAGVTRDIEEATSIAGRAAEGVGAGSGPWAEGVAARKGGAVAQSTGGSCVAACGEMLSGGAVTQGQLLAKIGEWSNPGDLAKSLGGGWRGGYFMSEADALGAAERGPMGAVLRAPGVPGHMVVTTPLGEGRFLVQDPWGGGSTYEVGSGWIKQYVAGGTFR